MEKLITAAFIVTQSIALANGLDALLKAIPEIDEVRVARDLINALQQVEELQPQIILVDSALLDQEPEVFLGKIVLVSPGTQRVLLVADVQDLKWDPRYAEAVLIEGIAPSTLARIVMDLLSKKGEEYEHPDSNE